MSCFYPHLTLIFRLLPSKIAGIFLILFCVFSISPVRHVNAQVLTVSEASNSSDVNNLVNNVLLGSCVTISNISYTGAYRAIGSFGNGAGNVGFSTGVLMTTGRCNNAPGPNNATNRSTSNSLAGDATLTAAIGSPTLDATVLEFDFWPLSDTMRFQYVFASEEYREYVNTTFNDAFGFFITGPGYPTPTNIALIPGTSVPVAINNVNNGNVSASTCPGAGPCEYCAYYVDNCATTTAEVQYDAWTTPLTAFALVQKCQQYHIKLVIADVGDRNWDSGVFLKANSFSGGAEISVDISTQSNPTGVWEGCNDAGFTFTKLNTSDLNTPVTVSFTLSGTAVSGVDYTGFPTTVTIPAGSMSTTIFINALLDGLTEGNETIILTLTTAPCGCTAPPTATLTIQDNTTLTATSTGSQTICLGQSASLTATPSGSQGPYTITWNNGGGTGSPITVSPTTTTTYTATISDVCNGQTVTRSETVTVIRSDYTIGSPTTQCLTGNNFTFTHTGSAGANYTWNFGDGSPIVNSQNATHSYSAGGTYTVTHGTHNGVCWAYSTQTVTVNTNPTATITGTNNFCTGGSTLLSATTSTAGSGTITGYQWRLNGSNIGGATSSTYTATAGGTYSVIVTNSNGCTTTSANFVVTVNANPTATITGTNNFCTGGSTTLSAASSTAGSGTITGYQWRLNGSNIGGATSSTYNATTAGTYSVIVTNSNGCSTTSSNFVVSVNANPTAVITGSPTTFCAGESVTLSSSTSTAGSGSITGRQWRLNGSDIGGATGTTYVASVAGNYTVVITNSNGCSTTSATTTVTVNANPTATITGNTSFCTGANTVLSASTSTAGSGTITGYQWRLNGSNIGGATSVSYTATAAGTYSVIVTNSNGCSTTSSNFVVTVNANPTATITGNTSFCAGTSTTLSAASSTAGSGTITGYQWRLNGSNIGGATSVTYTATAAGTYSVIVTNSNGCSTTSSNYVVSVNANPTATVTGNSSFCAGANTVLSASTSTAGSGTISGYQWRLNGSNIGGATSVTYTATAAGTYSVIVTNSNGCSTTSSNFVVTVNANPTATITGNTSFCAGTNTVLSAASSTAGSGSITGYQWRLNGSNIGGATSVTYTATAAGTYSVIVTNSNGCSTTSSNYVVTVNANPTATITGNTSFCAGTNTVLSATSSTAGSGSITGYQWRLNGSNISGATSVTYTATLAGTYSVIVTNSNGCSTTSSNYVVTINANPTATTSTTPVSCTGGNNGTATVTPAGGTPGYSYLWSPGGQTTATATNLTVGTYNVTVTDAAGCTVSASATVSQNDNTPPTALCRNVTVPLNPSGNATITAAQVDNGSTDNCGIASMSVSPSSFTCANVGANSVTLTVIDVNGNSSTCTATVTVVDNVAPNALCQNISVNLNAAGSVSITAAQVNNGSSDACGIASMTVSPSSFTCANVGANTVTLTVTDVNGNVSTCNATVTVNDVTPPTAVCQNISVVLSSSGNATITAAQINNGSSDACGIASLSVSPSSFDCSQAGGNTVTLTVTDVNGNTSTCTATVTIIDNTPPTAVCTNITAQLDGTGNATIAAGDVDDGSSDACGIDDITVSPNTFDCSDVGPNTVTLTVTDLSGNSSTCTATVTVVDNVDPIAICQNISVNLNASGNASITDAQVNNGSSDNCGIASMSVSPSIFTCANVGSNPVTLTVTDVNGNVSTCSSVVTVIDNTPPTAVCQNISINLGPGGTATITGAQVNNGSSDACGIASLSVSPNSFNCSNVGANTVTLTVTDVNGNSSTCTATVTVNDATVPTALCQNITVALNSSGNATITAAQVDNGSSDVCGSVSLSVSPSSFTCANIGANTVTLTVTDGAGNSSTCNATVTVVDNIAPTAVCQNITVQLDATGNATITAAQVNNGSSDACGIASLSVSPNSFTCANTGANNVTLTVTDNNGNSSTCTAVVTVQDNVPPTAVCQNISVNLNAAGNATITASQINNGSSDACGIASMTVSPSSFTCANIGANTVTLTVTDNHGNVSTCTATVTVNDITPPTALCQNISVNLNASGTATITAAQINNGSSDACGIASLSVSPSTFSCLNIGANTVTLTVTDNNGNVSTCTATVTVNDVTPPTAVCQNISVNLNASGSVTITAAQVNNGSSDACGIASLSVSPSTFSCSNIGTNNVTLTVTDNNGNSSTCTATVTVNDVTPPTAVCQNISVNLNSSGTATITASQINNGSSDACGIASLAVSPSTFNCTNIGANTVTLTVTDNNGNVSTCTATVTVNDITPPTAVCQNITVPLNASGTASITAAQVNNGSSDACGIASLSVSPSSFTCANLGANTVTLTVTDNNGNISTCTATVTITDNINPTAVCQNISASLNASGSVTITAAQVNNGSSDNCSIASMSVSPNTFTCANVGPNTVTLTVTDQSGNSSTCTATVTVQDNVAPTAICQNITVQLNASGTVSITAAQVNNGSFDNCAIASMSVSPNSFTCAGIGPNPVVLTVTDVNGNVSSCNATVTVQDNVAPVAVCRDISVDLNSSGVVTIAASEVDNGSSDACGIASISVSPSTFTCANVGDNTVTLTVTDNNGNVSTCDATVTVVDATNPVAVCQNITVQLNASGTASITAAQVNNGSSDACGIASLSVSPSNFTCANVGTNNVTLTVTDNNGNVSTCTAVVTVQDNIAPTALCRNVTVQLNSSGTASVNATQVNNGSTDNCGIASMTVSPNAFNCTNIGANTVTLTVTDVNGNSSTCTATVTVQDNVAPIAVCQNITVNLSTAGTASITAAQINNGSSDNCGIATISVSPSSFTCANVGANTVTLTVTDVNGNSSTCTATVTVVDNTPPTAICSNITVPLNTSGNASITAAQINNGSSDACGIASLSISPSTFNCSNVGANTVTLTVTDNNGNVSTCLSTVTVVDNVPPTALCQNISVNLNASGAASITAAQVNNGSSDNCGIASMSVSPNSFSCANVGANTVTLTVTDVNGNVSTCTATVTVNDIIPPVAVCQDITIQLNPAGAASITASQINNGSSDACGIASLSVSPSTFNCTNVGANTVTLTVTDNNGNSSTCTATVTVQNNVAPSVVCQDITVHLNAAGTVAITAAQVNNGSSASCGLASLAVTPSNFNCSNVGANTVTLTATDVNGNSSSCTAIVTVVDSIAPVAICQNISVNLSNGTASITASQIDNGSSDACGIASLSVSPNSFTCANVGANTVTLTVTDNNGNVSTCNATVTVNDITPPTAVCQNISVNLSASGTATITAAQINNGSSDACGIASLSVSPSSFTCANVGTNNVILTVTDNNGNSSTCSATVTVIDNTPPTALCRNVTVNLNASGTASITASQVNNGSSDACGIASLSVSPSTFTCANIGSNTVTLTVTDNNGNVSTCTATVTIVDNVAPNALCRNITVQLNAAGTASITAAQINNGSNDACGIASLSISPTTFTCANIGSNTVTLTVTDNNGNVSTCTSTVTIVDNVPPVALCRNISINLNASGNATITAAQVNNGSSDACGILSMTVSPNSFTCANVGNNNVTLTVTDIHGNVSTCTAIVTVNDITPPTAVCQNISINLNAAGTASITAAQINNGSSDVCGIGSLSVTPSSFTCTNVGTNTVVLTVTDVNGNTSTCNATVTVNDITPPTAVCQNITVQLDASGNASITANQVNNGSLDACGIASMSVSPNTFNCSNVGNNTVTLTVTDNNGNTSTCTSTVTVENNIAPVVICQNITVSLDASGNAVITASQVNNGSNAACGLSSLTVSPNTFNCSNIGLNTVTLTAVDNNGNTSTCTAQVTIVDNVAPVANCQNITAYLNGSGTVTVTSGQVDNGSSDACGIASMTTTPAAFTCAELGANTVTLTVTDNYGNSSTCTSIVNVADTIAPVALCRNISVNLNAAGNASITAAQVDNGSTDNCTIASLSVSPNSFTCANVGANTVTLTVTDQSGNVSTCTATVTVNDVTAPVAQCQNITVPLNGTGNATITAAQINNNSTDACGIASMTVSPSSFTCSNVGANPVVLTVTDVNGNIATCSAIVTVVDNVPPVATCQNVTVQLNASGAATVLASQVNNGSSDACGIASMSVSPNSFTCANVGPNTVTLTVTDNNGNVATCSATVTVVDNIAPTALCQNISVSLNASGNASITAAQINNGSTDNCGIASISVSPNTFTCANVGPNTVTLTVIDVNGNTSTCNATVTVIDNTPPTALCQNITVALNAAGNASITAAQINNGSSDACGIASMTVNPNTFNCSDVGANTVTLLVTDVNGNSSSCTATVTVQDNINPDAVCQNLTVALDGNGNAVVTAAQVDNGSSDNCGIASITLDGSQSQLSFDCSDVGINTVTLTVTDVNGNSSTCSANVTIFDNTNPNAICQNITAQLDANGNIVVTAAQINNGSNDACGIASIAINGQSQISYGCTDVGTNTVTLTVTDNNGNVSTCLATITVEDNVAPNAICQNITAQLDANGQLVVTAAQIDNGSNDNCGIASITLDGSQSQLSFDCSDVGDNTVTLTVTDVNGNISNCTATVTVEDTVDPTAICQNITVQLDQTGSVVVTAFEINNNSTDNCGIASLEINGQSQISFGCTDVGDNTVTLTVTDVNGNTSTCTATVTVLDNVSTPPTALCQNITVQLDATGNVSITAAQIDNGSFDNCGIASMSVSPNAFTCANVGANTVTLTVTDLNGNVATCNATVTVEDTIAPNAICQNITVALDASGNVVVTAAEINNGSNDNCGIASIEIDGQSQLSFGCTNVGDNTVTLTVTDVNGNVSTCSATITVEDNIAPTAICQNITVALDANGNVVVTAAEIDSGSSDNCGIASIEIDGQSQLSFGCTNVGDNTVTLTVTDVNGNVSTCSATITVEDNIAPNAICQNITVALDANGNVVVTAAEIDNGSSDNCGIASIEIDDQSQLSFGCTDVGDNTVTLTVTDVNGNVSTCSATITVEDNVAPNAICQNITVALDASGNVVVTAAEIDNGSNDNCGIASIVIDGQSQLSFGCTEVGDNTVTLTVTDVNGNVSTCSATITIEDNIAPDAICQNITVALDANGNAIVTATEIDNWSNDNCGIASITLDGGQSQLAFDCSNVGDNTVTLTVTDVNGNVSTCTATISVEDNVATAPTAICQNITVELDANGNATITAAQIDNGSFDNCGIASMTVSPSTFDCSNIGANTVTLTVTDNNGNVSTCDATVTIEDNTAPTVVCQDITVQLDANGNALITAIDIDGGSTDNCSDINSGLTFSASQTSFDCSNIGANTITLTVTDANGNSSTCDATVTVADTVAPIAICQNITVQLDANGQVVIVATDIDNGSSDNCSTPSTGLTFSASQTTFTCADEGTNTVTLTVTDAFGNVSTCDATVTVENNVTPTVICQNITVQLDANGNASITAADVDGGSAAACGIASLTVSPSTFDCSNVGPNTVTLTATDNSGNISTCDAIVTIEDTISPTIVCQNITVQLDANGNAVITGIDIDNGSTDNCSSQGSGLTYTASQTNFDCSNIGANTVTLTLTDANGNSSSCDATVTVADTVAPTVICQNITVALDANGQVVITSAQVDNGSFDNCSTPGNGLTFSIDQSSFNCSDVGDNTVTLTVTDAFGNTSSCAATVTVVDTIAPIAICQDIIIQLEPNGQVVVTPSQLNNGSSDNCGIASMVVNPATFTCSEVGPNPISLTVTDVNGNVSVCNAIVDIQDNVPPVAICQDITVQLDANGQASITAADVDNGSADACGIASMTVSPNTFDCSDVGNIIVTLTVTDINGNADTCHSVVTVADTISPVAVCQNITVALDENGLAFISAAEVDNGSTDNCGIFTMVLSETDFDCADVGANTVTLTVTDVNGNSSTCTSVVTVEDNIAPEFTFCPADIVVQPDSSNCNPFVTWNTPTATDNCGVSSLTSNFVSGDNFPVGTTTVIYTATDASGNTTTCEFDVTILANPLLVDAIADTVNCGYNVACTGGSTGTATALPAGGCMPYTYLWSDGQTTQVATGLSATAYSVTLTDALGNTATTSVTLTEPAPLAVDSLTSPVNSGGWNINCANTNNAVVYLNVVGGSDCLPYSYSWTGPNGFTSADEDLNFVYAGTYYVTITDVNGCSITDSITLTEPDLLEVNLIDQVDVSCNGLSDGMATVLAEGGANGYQYLWSDGQTTATADSLGAGVYFVSVTDNNGCIATTNVTIGEPNPLIAYATVESDYNGQDVSCFGDADGIVQVLVNGGTPNYTFLWSNGATDAVLTDLAAGTYFVTATDMNGCDTTVSVTLVDPPQLTADVVEVINPSCNGVANGSATVQAAGGTPGYFYFWSNNQTGETATGLASGSYTVTVSDTNGCNIFITVDVGEPDPLTIASSDINVTDVSCNGGNDGAIDITPSGGTAPYTYLWNTGATTEDISGLIAGTYTVALADSLGCDTTISIVVNEPAQLVASISSTVSPTCNGNNNGSATADGSGGTAPYTYLWIDGQTTQTAVNLVAGTYDVIITDANGCTATTQATVTEPAAVDVNAVITSNFNGQHITCFGAANGVATVSTTGGTAPYTYLWSNGQTTSVISGLFAGIYIVTATDANGCTMNDTVTIVNPPDLIAVISNTSSVSCQGLANGSATVNVTGGTTPYTYSWNNGQTTQTAVNLAFGVHQVTVVDANGCSETVFANITQPPALTATVNTILNVTCNGGSNGAGFIDVVGGTAPYTYAWSDGTTTEDLNGVGAGNYTVLITDNSGCDTTLSLTITEPTAMVASIVNQVNVGCSGGSTGEATIDVSGGVPGYTYQWSNGQTTQTATGLPAGLHSVTVRDANNCITIVNFVITENAVISAGSVQVNNVSCNGGTDGSISFNVAGGSAPYTYLWSNGQTEVPATGLAAGNHSVTITDNAGCILDLSFTVSEPDAIALNITNIVQPACGGSATGQATVVATGGTTPYTYAWDNGQTSANATGLTSGVHSVVVTDASGCSDSTTVTITSPGNITISVIGSSEPTCFGGVNGTASVFVQGGTPGYTYSWSPNGGTNATVTGLAAGTHIVIVTDANQCSASQTITIGQPAQLVADISGGGNTVCAGDSVTISATATGGSGNYTFTWDNGLGNGASQVVFPSTPTTYTVSVTDNNGCIGLTDSVLVTISTPPVAAFTLPSNVYSCTYPVTVNFTNTSTNAVQYSWDFGNNTTATTTNGQATFDSTGTYMVVLTATSANGCVDTAVYMYNVYPAPTASFSLSGSSGCAPYTVTFTNNSVDGVNYTWDFGDGDTSNLSNPTHTYEIPGSYNVTLIVSGGGVCNDTLELGSAVTVYQTPVADFTSDYYNIVDPDGQIQFTNLSTGATSYNWNFGDGNTSTQTDPVNNYAENGSFDVTLIATSGSGCADTITQSVDVALFKGLFMPSAFIAGGNDEFNLFLPKGMGIAKYRVLIFDKWGNLLWESSKLVNGQPAEGWDGRYNGVIVPQGAYIWKADATFTDGTQWEGMEQENGRYTTTGNVTVLQ